MRLLYYRYSKEGLTYLSTHACSYREGGPGPLNFYVRWINHNSLPIGFYVHFRGRRLSWFKRPRKVTV